MWQLAIDGVYCNSLQKYSPSVGSYIKKVDKPAEIKTFPFLRCDAQFGGILQTSKLAGLGFDFCWKEKFNIGA